MLNRPRALWLCALTVACARDPAPRPGRDYRVEVVASGLVIPWSLALAPDGRLFVAERTGRIRMVRNDSLLDEPWAVLPAIDGTSSSSETGLMGMALDPDFPSHAYVYVCYTERRAPGRIVNRVARLREDGQHQGVEPTILLDGIPAGQFHNGCRVKIGPDRKLYVTTGDAYQKTPAQELSSLAGKVLRLELDGAVPHDNPTPGSPVWTMGHRNPQGIAWDPVTNVGYVTEHGDAFIDEINALGAGANYGWPAVQGTARDSSPPGKFRNPALVFHVAPAGAVFIGKATADAPRDMLVASLQGRLIRLSVDGNVVKVADDSVLVGYGRLRDVIAAPDGSIYVSTSNRDGRGKRHWGDDRVLHIWLQKR